MYATLNRAKKWSILCIQCYLIISIYIRMSPVYAQQTSIEGTVTDESGFPLEGVTVKLLKAGDKVTSDISGNFLITKQATEAFSRKNISSKICTISRKCNVLHLDLSTQQTHKVRVQIFDLHGRILFSLCKDIFGNECDIDASCLLNEYRPKQLYLIKINIDGENLQTPLYSGNSGSVTIFRSKDMQLSKNEVVTIDTLIAAKSLFQTKYILLEMYSGKFDIVLKHIATQENKPNIRQFISAQATVFPSWCWSSAENNGLFRLKLDNDDMSHGAITTTDTCFSPLIALNEGEHTLYVQQMLGNGEWSEPATSTVLVDTTKPTITLTSHSKYFTLYSSFTDFFGIAADNLGVVGLNYSITGATVKKGIISANDFNTVWSVPFICFKPGLSTIVFKAVDATLINAAVCTLTVNMVVDTSSPDKAFIPPGMRPIQGGKHTIGGGVEISNENPINVIVSSFYIDTTEVSIREFLNFCKYNPGEYDTTDVPGDVPVGGVCWLDAMLYCNAKSKLYKLDTVYSYTLSRKLYVGEMPPISVINHVYVDNSAKGFRLPTEAEWEIACRAGTTSKFFWDEMEGDYTKYVSSWYPTLSTYTLPNKWGLYGMIGNIGELCQEVYCPFSDWNSYFDNISKQIDVCVNPHVRSVVLDSSMLRNSYVSVRGLPVSNLKRMNDIFPPSARFCKLPISRGYYTSDLTEYMGFRCVLPAR